MSKVFEQNSFQCNYINVPRSKLSLESPPPQTKVVVFHMHIMTCRQKDSRTTHIGCAFFLGGVGGWGGGFENSAIDRLFSVQIYGFRHTFLRDKAFEFR